MNDTVSATAGAIDRVYGARVWLTNATQGKDELRSVASLPPGITSSVSADSLMVTFTGEAPIASYQAAIRTIEYQYSSSVGTECLQTELNIEFERFLPLSQCVAGNIAEANEIVFDNLNDNSNVTPQGHAYLYEPTVSQFPARRAFANSLSLDTQPGYLAHETNETETLNLAACFPYNTYLGATDNMAVLNSITGPSAPSDPAEIKEGNWFWVDGPPSETTRPFWLGNCSRLAPDQTVPCQPGPAANGYARWNGGEPNDYPNANVPGEEDYTERYWSGNRWNDIFTNSAPHPSLVEFGGSEDGSGNACEIEDRPAVKLPIRLSRQTGDVQITKTNCQAGFVPGQTSTYVIEARAVNTCYSADAQVLDTLGAGLSPVGQWSCTNTAATIAACPDADTNNSTFYDGQSACTGGSVGNFPLQTNIRLEPNSGVYFVYQAMAEE